MIPGTKYSVSLPPESHSQSWIRYYLPLLWLQKRLLPPSCFVTCLRSLSWLLNCCFIASALSPWPHSSLLAAGTRTPMSLDSWQGLVESLVHGRHSANVCFVLFCAVALKIKAYNVTAFCLYILWYLEPFTLWERGFLCVFHFTYGLKGKDLSLIWVLVFLNHF